jgi:N-methylhydantoinase A
LSLIIAVDTGGTFTDLVAFDQSAKKVLFSKSLTTYDDLVIGILDCTRKAGVEVKDGEIIKFGTTLVINTFLQRNGARTALVTTEGFRDVMELRRGNRTRPFDLRYRRDPALVDRNRRFEIRERMSSEGNIVTPLDRAALEPLAARLKAMKVEAVAVALFNAYANPDHEIEIATFLRERLPECYISAGTELSREWYEYERTSTAAANAYVGPALKQYVVKLESVLRAAGFEKAFFMMASNGGVFSVKMAQEQPVMLVESGPVGGCIGAAVYARELGLSKMIAFDMGGTTAKCAIVENGGFEVKSPYYVGGNDCGFPVHGAVVDIVEVGTGGGSIAWLDAHNRIHVGPRSAGSTPGPVAYGRGGLEPTVTDANLALGRIGASSFLGGEMTLDVAAAAAAIDSKVAAPLGLLADNATIAQGILDLASIQMANAIRQVTVERGFDPRDFVLFAFGGGGPIHSIALARELNIPEIIIPPQPGNFSALGMLMADVRIDQSRTFLRRVEASTMEELETSFHAMQADLTAKLQAELGHVDVTFERQAELRYRGQKQATRINFKPGQGAAEVHEGFYDMYLHRFGHVDRKSAIEFVGLSVFAMAALVKPSPADLSVQPAGSSIVTTTRPIYFAEAAAWIDTPVYRRDNLPAGFTCLGPAAIEEYGSTTLVPPNTRLTVGALGELRILLPQANADQAHV